MQIQRHTQNKNKPVPPSSEKEEESCPFCWIKREEKKKDYRQVKNNNQKEEWLPDLSSVMCWKKCEPICSVFLALTLGWGEALCEHSPF